MVPTGYRLGQDDGEETTVATQRWHDRDGRIVGPQDEAAARETELQSRALAHRLVEVRTRQGITQVQLAELMGVSQARVSRIEQGDTLRNEVATLRAYITALGGRLELVADFPAERMVLG